MDDRTQKTNKLQQEVKKSRGIAEAAGNKSQSKKNRSAEHMPQAILTGQATKKLLSRSPATPGDLPSGERPGSPAKPQRNLVVNRVVDSLDVRLLIPHAPSRWLFRQLPGWRKHRDTWNPGADPLTVEVPELGTFTIQPTSRPYEWVLINPEVADIRIWNPDKWETAWKGQTGQFYVSFRSAWLQAHDLDEVRLFLAAVAGVFCHAESPALDYEPFQRVARADLACDLAEARDMTWGDLDDYTCRSRKRDAFTTPYHVASDLALKALGDRLSSQAPPMDNKGGANTTHAPAAGAAKAALGVFARVMETGLRVEDQGFVSRVVASRTPQTVYFGRFGSQVYGRVYNKLLSLPVQDKLYMLDVWVANGWDGSSPVWRTEFSLSGEFLKDCIDLGTGERDLRDLDAFLVAVPNLWAYLTGEWLVHHARSKETRVERRPVSDRWAAIRAAWEGSQAIKRDRPLRNPKEAQIMAQIKGCIVTLAALRADADEALNGIAQTIEELAEFSTEALFPVLQAERRRMLGIDDFSDTYLSSMYRSDRIKQGLGS